MMQVSLTVFWVLTTIINFYMNTFHDTEITIFDVFCMFICGPFGTVGYFSTMFLFPWISNQKMTLNFIVWRKK